jgi:polysaccharide export outer membrane protein
VELSLKTSFGNKAFLMAVMIASSLFLSACVGANYSKLPPVPTDILPEAPVAKKLPAYRAQIGDVLEFKFYLNPEFDETVTVRPDGMISTNVMEDIYVYNQTIKEINKQVRKNYSKELKDPKVKTIVRSFAPIRIYVSGEVNSPGEFIVVGQALTLTQAIARAGGIKNSGDASKVLIIRRGADEESLVFRADYDAATQLGDAKKDARLAPSDVVFVPKSGAAQAYKNYQQYIQQYVNPSIGASYSIGGD